MPEISLPPLSFLYAGLFLHVSFLEATFLQGKLAET
jgi:hypothetical protein